MITEGDYSLLTEQLRTVLVEFVGRGDADDIMDEFDTSLQESGLIQTFTTYEDLSHFQVGDIIYSYETCDCFATIFKLGEPSASSDIISSGKTLVLRNGKWDVVGFTVQSDNDKYRYATEEEIKLFNKLTAKNKDYYER